MSTGLLTSHGRHLCTGARQADKVVEIGELGLSWVVGDTSMGGLPLFEGRVAVKLLTVSLVIVLYSLRETSEMRTNFDTLFCSTLESLFCLFFCPVPSAFAVGY
jgi:hypothetical protein